MSNTPTAVHRLQDKLLVLLGNTPQGRGSLVSSMLRRNASEVTSYWLQLVVSVGIATLGLVVGSTAVVIGAMLVAPLMGPIVALAMGLATGSPFLVLRSVGRIGFSVLLAVGGAAVTTLFLPFHEINDEIASRTAPTLLDLITAAFCALAGVYATLKASSDTATTAAGTSISISLVPPLCASGFGFGTQNWFIASGAALLFLTNLVAIVVVGSGAFLLAGFSRIDVLALEEVELLEDVDGAPLARAVSRRLSGVFATRWGSVFRLLMPFVLLAAVYVPLRRGLDEVAWQVRVRSFIQKLVESESLRVVQTRVRVERHEVDVAVVALGSVAETAAARERMYGEIERVAGVVPRVEVLAVADANAVAGLQSSLLSARSDSAPVVKRTVAQDLDEALSSVRSAVEELWPHAAVGKTLAIDVGSDPPGPLPISVLHLGETLSPAATETLQHALRIKLQRDVRLLDNAIPSTALTPTDSPFSFLATVAAAVQAAARFPSVNVCVTLPQVPPDTVGSKGLESANLLSALNPLLARNPNVTTTSGEALSVLFALDACPVPLSPPVQPTVEGTSATPDGTSR